MMQFHLPSSRPFSPFTTYLGRYCVLCTVYCVLCRLACTKVSSVKHKSRSGDGVKDSRVKATPSGRAYRARQLVGSLALQRIGVFSNPTCHLSKAIILWMPSPVCSPPIPVWSKAPSLPVTLRVVSLNHPQPIAVRDRPSWRRHSL